MFVAVDNNSAKARSTYPTAGRIEMARSTPFRNFHQDQGVIQITRYVPKPPGAERFVLAWRIDGKSKILRTVSKRLRTV